MRALGPFLGLLILSPGCARRDEGPEYVSGPAEGKAKVGPCDTHEEPVVTPQGRELDVVTNSIGMKLLLIPAGEFMMGSPEDEKGRSSVEGPVHRIRITKPFLMGMHEVTVGQFRQFVDATGHETDAERRGGDGYDAGDRKLDRRDPKYNWRNTGFLQDDDHPVVNVSWRDATAFCQWLSDKEGQEYRLPREAEWEYACRAGTTTRYWFGDDAEGLAEVDNVGGNTTTETFSGRAKDGYVFTAPVGGFRPNGLGIHSMHGNVQQWCQDWYASDYYRDSPTDDPTGPATGSFRVIRGGSWYHGPSDCRSATRTFHPPVYGSCYLGFRVVSSYRAR